MHFKNNLQWLFITNTRKWSKMHLQNYIFCVVLLCSVFYSVCGFDCHRKTQKDLSHTRCVAGRRFFAKFDQIPSIARMFSAKNLNQPYVYPWIAEIVAFYAGRFTTCTGTLINDIYVITAQQCVSPPLEAQHIKVSLGYQEDSNEPNQYLETTPSLIENQILEIILHPDYDFTNAQTTANDLALLKLNPVTYSTTIYPIQLPTIADKYYELSNIIGENVGWQYPITINNKNREEHFTKTFYKTPVQIINNDDCKNFNVYYLHAINNNVLCTRNVEKRLERSCNRNVGSPLMVENHKRIYNITVLAGIVSWSGPRNNPCMWHGSPVVYVRIDNKLQWILDNTKDAQYCRY